MKWIKKIMEAKQLTFENQAEIKEWCNGKTWSLPPMRAVTGIKLEAAYGMDTASFGDWIIKDENGFWPCKPDIFEKTYESASLPSSSVTREEDKDLIPDEIYKDIADFFKYSKYRGPYTIQKYGGSMIVKFMDGSKAKCSIQMWQGEEVVLDDQPTTPVTGESEAIGFAEWAGSSYSYAGDNIWEGDDDDTITTSELYNLYKQSKK